jgi:hypothetical protein
MRPGSGLNYLGHAADVRPMPHDAHDCGGVPTFSARERVADFWDQHVAAWLSGDDGLCDRLSRWHASYLGRGDGEVRRDAFIEPYGGDLRGAPRMVMLGLNPGGVDLAFQGRDGIFAEEIREFGSYSQWATSTPYARSMWTDVHGANDYGRRRLRFARHWLEDDAISHSQLLTFELYPWHSTRVTAQMAPPEDLIEEFIWQPLAELPHECVFAFGKPWLAVCERLGLPEVGRWGCGGSDLGSRVASRAAVAFELRSGQCVVVSWQSGYAGPFGRADAVRLRERVTRARRLASS